MQDFRSDTKVPDHVDIAPSVSFIAIGRNQARTLRPCLESVFRAARQAGLESFEVIFVDSGSSDESVSLVRSLFGASVLIVSLTGAMNAGIARNVGANTATGKVLFFIDGDMEVDTGFLREALDPSHALVHPVVTGQLPEKLYDPSGRLLGDAPDRYRIRTRHHRPELGGVFLIDQALFRRIGGFAPELRSNEDLDLGLRLARAGVLTLALPCPIAIHHTVEYLEWARLLPMIRNGSLLYPGALFRRHVTNRHYWPILASHQRATAVLLASIGLALWLDPLWLGLYLAYVGAKNLRRPGVSLLQDLVGTTARSICFLIGVVAFAPARVPAESITFAVSNSPP